MPESANIGFIPLTDPQEETIIRKPDDLTDQWLSARLGNVPVTKFTVKRVETWQVSNELENKVKLAVF